MTNTKGIDWKNVSFIVGQRTGQVQDQKRKSAYARDCQNCTLKTYTETEYPLDVPVLCNKCAAQITAQFEQDASTHLLFDLPNDVKARLLDIALQRRLPVEKVAKEFLEWKLGKPTNAIFKSKSEEKK